MHCDSCTRFKHFISADIGKAVFFGKEGDFSSPGYPNFYPDYLDDLYQIRGTSGNSIEITFHEISLEPEINCPYDYLSVGFNYCIKHQLYLFLCCH